MPQANGSFGSAEWMEKAGVMPAFFLSDPEQLGPWMNAALCRPRVIY